jgi:hypothetical protein
MGLIKRLQGISQVEVNGGLGWSKLQSPAVAVDSTGRVTLMMMGQAEQCQRLRISGLSRKDLPIKLRRSSQIAARMALSS